MTPFFTKVRRVLVVAGTLTLGLLDTLQAADLTPYWSYSYEGVEVMAPGDGDYARTLAHNVHRLEVALTKLLDQNPDELPGPAHVYSLHHADYTALLSANSDVKSFFSHQQSYSVLDASSAEWYYKGAYLGVAGTILLHGKRAYPRWVHEGFARMAGTARINGPKVTLGATDKWLGRVFSASTLKFIPTNELLSMGLNDPLLKDGLMRDKYTAECWVLVHLITVEGIYKPEFSRYLALLDTGSSPAEAFASGFRVPYEDLDKLLRDTLSKGKLRMLTYDVPDEPDTNQLLLLSPAEAHQKIAQLGELLRNTR